MDYSDRIEKLEEQKKSLDASLESLSPSHPEYNALKDQLENISVRVDHIHQTISTQKSYSSSDEGASMEGMDEQFTVMEQALQKLADKIQELS